MNKQLIIDAIEKGFLSERLLKYSTKRKIFYMETTNKIFIELTTNVNNIPITSASLFGTYEEYLKHYIKYVPEEYVSFALSMIFGNKNEQ